MAAAAASLGHAGLDARAIFIAHLDGQKWATNLINQAAAAIAIQIADLTTIFGLEKVAIGGSIGLAEGFIDRIQDHLNTEPSLFRPVICPAQLGSDSPLYGAMCI